MSSVSDELLDIGRALVTGGRRSISVSLTDQQRAILASATEPDTLEAIATNIEFRRGKGRGQIRVPAGIRPLGAIASTWADQCRAGFSDPETLRHIATAIEAEALMDHLHDLIADDDRLTSHERECLLSVILEPLDHHAKELSHSQAYVKSVNVAGFRAIGPPSHLDLDPNLGLAVVYGPNGSGKSSFVEALDVLLTGHTARLDLPGGEWHQGLVNVHRPQESHIDATFTFDDGQQNDCHLTCAPATGTRNSSLIAQLKELGWSNALDEYRPILGHGEIGPLFQEELQGSRSAETQFAQHVRLRTGITDPLVEHLRSVGRSGLSHQSGRSSLYAQLRSWGLLQLYAADARHEDTQILLCDGEFRPKQWDWQQVTDWAANAEIPNDIRSAIRMIASTHNNPSLDRANSIPADYSQQHSARIQVYCQMLVDAIYRARLSRFSESVVEAWSAIRPGSAIGVNELTIRQVSPPPRAASNHGSALRVSLNLSVDGISGVERGVLSQGEIQALALCLFLPTMSRLGSPFKFAVIDDPIQVMDQYAVVGLARVLAKYANNLQLIVFTHDDRLIKALRLLEIDHTLINVTRSKESVVQCEVIDDPVKQRLTDARQEAKRPASHDKIGRRQDVGDQCRRAIEAACIRAVRARLTREGEDLTPQDVEDEIDRALQNSSTSTRLLLALAIFGDTDQDKVGEVGKFVSKSDDWGRWVDRTIRRVNGLAHANDEETARAVYAGDLHELIDDVERLTQTIEVNCG